MTRQKRKSVAQMKTLGVVGFKDLCDEVSKIGMAPRGVVKLVLDGLIDTLNMDINKGFSVQLGEFGCFRPGINAKSQDKLEDVKASTIYRRKIIFTPGFYFKDMLTRASVEKMDCRATAPFLVGVAPNQIRMAAVPMATREKIR